MRRNSGQTMVLLAVLLPLCLLPALAYSAEAGLLAAHSARLQEAVARTALDAAQALDQDRLRAGGGATLAADQARARALVSLQTLDPSAHLDGCQVEALRVVVSAHEDWPDAFAGLLGGGRVRLSARASARLNFSFTASG
ncbi:MAG TPA: hypothetical protein VNI34_03325 [Candidatus Nitrosotalea sp.]|nr:hypothetical protein [Candidatus Nitrosotalea sp.]